MTDLCATGSHLLYHLWDAGDEIVLEAAAPLPADRAPARRRPAGSEARALSIPTPPLVVSLDSAPLVLRDQPFEVEWHATLFDLRGRLAGPADHAAGPVTWEKPAATLGGLIDNPELATLAGGRRDQLIERVRSAVRQPRVAEVVEEYAVVQLTELQSGDAATAGDPSPQSAPVARTSSAAASVVPSRSRVCWDAIP